MKDSGSSPLSSFWGEEVGLGFCTGMGVRIEIRRLELERGNLVFQTAKQ